MHRCGDHHRRRSVRHHDPGGVGIRHRQFRLVDRHRPRRDADFSDSLAAAAKVASVDQSLRRSHDAVCGRLRGLVSADPPGASLVFLLAGSLSEHDGDSTAVSQSVGLGRVCGFHLFYGFFAVLVSRFDSRPRHLARSSARADSPLHLRHARHGLARLGNSLASLRNCLFTFGRLGDAARGVRSHGGQL